MNKRTVELYTQALDFAYNKIGKEHAGKGFFEAAVAGTFAELIVKECISVVDYDDGATHVRELLLEHFGVEE
jgi:hypothetical protein